MQYIIFIALASLSFQANAHNGTELTHWIQEPDHLMVVCGLLFLSLMVVSQMLKDKSKSSWLNGRKINK